MRVLNVIQCAELGGMEVASLRLMQGLITRGHTCRLLSLNPIGALGPLLEQSGIPHEGLPYFGKGGWRSYSLLKRRLSQIEADGLIMTGHNLLGMVALGNLCQSRRLLMMHFHHKDVKPAWQWRLIYALACRRFKAVTFASDYIRSEAEKLWPPVHKIAYTIRNEMPLPVLPTAEQRSASRQALGFSADDFVAGNAGWLIPRKRLDVFLRVAGSVVRRCPKARFVIAGDGMERQRLESLANGLGLGSRLRWLGWQRNLDQFYSSLDALLFNSDWDAMGLTPLEAMSWGVPVVASVVNGGLSEVITDSSVGFLAKEHNVEKLSSRLLELASDAQLRDRIGLAGRQRIQTMNAVQVSLDSIERLLGCSNEHGL